MSEFSHGAFLRAWFPSLAPSKNAAEFFWSYNRFLCTTPRGKRSVLDDKLLLSGLLTVSGVRTPRVLLSIIGGQFVSPSGAELSEAAAARLLVGREAFIKTRTGYGGHGSFRLHADGTIHSADGSRVNKSVGGLLKNIKRTDYLIQELVR